MSRFAAARSLLPAGRSLPDDVWRARHRGILVLLGVESVFIVIFALIRGYSPGHAAFEGTLIALPGLAAAFTLPRRLREAVATFGLLMFSAVLVHISGGTIEAHFSYFAMLGVVILYQHWLPFLLYVAFVFGQHAIGGLVDPGGVYNHPAAVSDPWTWALIHATFILAASAALLIGWRRNELLHERAERSYRDLYEGERALVQVKEQLLQTASHELRTPLTVVMGFVRTLRQHWSTLSESQKLESLEVVDRRASQMSVMVDQFLTITQIESGTLTVNTEEIDVAQLVAQLAQAEGDDIEIRVHGDPKARGNRDYVLLILSNYLGNARKYGKPPLVLEALEVAGAIEIAVCDAGDGVPSEFAPHLFEKFTQANPSQAGDGFGLGLSLVQTLAQVQDGSVGYTPSAGGGARFFVRLPSSKPAGYISQRPAMQTS